MGAILDIFYSPLLNSALADAAYKDEYTTENN